MVTSSVTLLLAGAVYVTYDLITFRRAMSRDLTILADIIGNNSTAALAFDDQQAGLATLASLRAQEHIASACLFGKEGRLFAAYYPGELPSRPLPRGPVAVVPIAATSPFRARSSSMASPSGRSTSARTWLSSTGV
jgi:hypothetical protein